MTDFGLDNYLNLEAKQQPTWADLDELANVKQQLALQPPLVFAGEVDTLRERLAAAARGEAFLLQGGDCAETFVDATADRIRNRIKTVLQMAVVLMYGSSLPVIKMGRMAGQFAKPRSSDTETRDGVTLPAYRGDLVRLGEWKRRQAAPGPKVSRARSKRPCVASPRAHGMLNPHLDAERRADSPRRRTLTHGPFARSAPWKRG